MTLMLVVIKFGLCDYGTLYEQFCHMQQLYVKFMKRLVKGQMWAEVTHVTIWGHMKVLPMYVQSYETIFVWVSYFFQLLFCTQSGEGSCFLGFEMCVIIFALLPPI